MLTRPLTHRALDPAFWAVLPLFLALSGCSMLKATGDRERVSQSAASTSSHEPYRSLYDEAHHNFKSVWLLKPREGSADVREFDLAPLIVQEVMSGSGGAPRTPRFGALEAGDDGEVGVNHEAPSVYVETGTIRVRSVSYETLTFRWYYSRGMPPHTYIDAKALRLVLDSDGFTVAYDMTHIPSVYVAARGPRRLFVSKSFERAAREEFGGPLPGRRFSAEKGLAEAPLAVVIRVVEDGPQPMGPYVYIGALTCRVITLLCRCSPSQMDEVLESGYYDLVPFDRVRDLARRIPGSPLDAGDDQDAGVAGPVEDALRWPRTLDGGS